MPEVASSFRRSLLRARRILDRQRKQTLFFRPLLHDKLRTFRFRQPLLYLEKRLLEFHISL